MLESFDFGAIFTAAGLAKLGQIIVGDLTMAGDNVVIMGSLASGLPAKERRKVLMFGVAMALVFLITFAVVATQLLKITGLIFAGGLLLLWLPDLQEKGFVLGEGFLPVPGEQRREPLGQVAALL